MSASQADELALMIQTLRLSAILLFAASLSAASTEAAAYNFVKIVDSEGTLTGPGAGASLNNSGVVAFQGFTSAGSGVFTSNGSTITTIVEPGNSFTSIGSTAINDSGVVAFVATADSASYGLYTGSGNGLTTVVAPNGPVLPFGDVSINNNGAIAYSGAGNSLASTGVYKHIGGMSTQLANAAGSFRDFGGPEINDAGDVTFYAAHDAVNTTGFYKVPNGQVRETIVEGLGTFNPQIRPSLNNAGTIAFTYANQQLGYGVFTYNNGAIAKVLNTAGPFKEFSQTVDVNNQGVIAFTGTLDNNVRGIYVGSDPVNDKVIEVGGSLFGSKVTEIYNTPNINNRGDVIFYYQLANGTTGLALARAVPEPAAGSLAIVSLAVVALRRRTIPVTTSQLR
ncbi:choice-of-anchor tandem repeat NxxGxxAF-containing protein [Lacipirellula sp.]|uniref:choice-of-anchor tandem repeat NxxGxxAF-containing protein n=1 Tax=Lacipirellula sp. TaxID=2691419 RepID=UPI003D0DA94B